MFYSRNRGTTRSGSNFSEHTVQAIWEKATAVAGYDSTLLRKDSCGAWIKRTEYGNTNSDYGWEVDHIRPVAQGGGDELTNLQALQWDNNRYKSDSYPNWSCKLKAA